MNTEKLEKMHACEDAIEWCKLQKSRAQAWQDCQHGDWMLWLLGKLSGRPESRSRKKLILCTCECAQLALKYVPKGENRPRIAIENAEKYARGECTIEEVKNATHAAVAAAYARDAAVAAEAVYTDVYAARAAEAVYAGIYAARAAEATYAAVYAGVYAAHAAVFTARAATLSQCADIVRKHYPKCPRF